MNAHAERLALRALDNLNPRFLPMQPFIEPQHLALALFPPIQLAFLPFCVAGVLLLSIVTGYTGVLLINEGLQGLRPSAATT